MFENNSGGESKDNYGNVNFDANRHSYCSG